MRFTLTDLVTSILLVLLIGALGLTAGNELAETDRRAQCAMNLRQVGMAMLLYANENRGSYPRVRYNAKSPKPVWGTPYNKNKDLHANNASDPFADKKDEQLGKYAPAANDITAALFLLLRTEDLTSTVFVCPSTLQEYWNFGGGEWSALHWTNFAGDTVIANHLSYSFQNPYPTQEALENGFRFNNALPENFAVASDMNPGVSAVLKVKDGSSEEETKAANSLNHFRDGQNVLYADGHIEFKTNCLAGMDGDNIFAYGKPAEGGEKANYGIVGAPARADDSILLPTARDLKLCDAQGKLAAKRDVTGVTDQTAKTLHEKYNGRYAYNNETIEITDDKITVTDAGTESTIDYTLDLSLPDRVGAVYDGPEGRKITLILILRDNVLHIPGSPPFAGSWNRQ